MAVYWQNVLEYKKDKHLSKVPNIFENWIQSGNMLKINNNVIIFSFCIDLFSQNGLSKGQF